MDWNTFFKRLEKARYFEGYTQAAIDEAVPAIQKELAAGMAGPNREAFERFPGLSLVVADVDMEMMGEDDLKLVLRQLGKASFGMFAPRSIKVNRAPNGEPCGLTFQLNGTSRTMVVDYDSWIPGEFFEEVAKLTKQECSGLEFQGIEYPDSGQSGFFVWCTPRALRSLERAKLVPSQAHPLSGDPPPPEPKPKKEPKRDLAAEFALPADTGRVDRLGIFRRGKWRLPELSEKNLIAWRELAAADTTSETGFPLRKQIERTFDLLCACDLGISEIGNAADYARKVLTLVDRYLFGTWRNGHVVEGRVLSEAEALKELSWDDEVRMGCAAASKLGDLDALRKLLRYPGQDILEQYREFDLAYHRLLSDLVRERQDWDWSAQSAMLEKCYDSRRPKLLACLVALRANDAAAFAKAIRKFATKPLYVPPFTFAGAIDWDVTTLCGLALHKGWPCDFPERLQDKILDRRKA